jgi:excisionase family DNA binding protein
MRTRTTLPSSRSRTSASQGPAGRLRSGAVRLLRRGRGISEAYAFTPLIDAKAASGLLGVPHTWLLAQAREGRIPHHRLGHYVRFNPEDLKEWLGENKILPTANGWHPR